MSEEVNEALEAFTRVLAYIYASIWAYLVSNNVPYLSLYDSRAELVGYDKVRFATLFDPEMADLGAESVDNVLHWRWRHEHR